MAELVLEPTRREARRVDRGETEDGAPKAYYMTASSAGVLVSSGQVSFELLELGKTGSVPPAATPTDKVPVLPIPLQEML